jgi:hypothetical protein
VLNQLVARNCSAYKFATLACAKELLKHKQGQHGARKAQVATRNGYQKATVKKKRLAVLPSCALVRTISSCLRHSKAISVPSTAKQFLRTRTKCLFFALILCVPIFRSLVARKSEHKQQGIGK